MKTAPNCAPIISNTVITHVLAWLAFVSTTTAHGQTVVALSQLASESPQRRFAQIDAQTGVIASVSPLGPTSYAGLGAAPDGQFFGLTWAFNTISKLYSLDVTTNMSTLIGDMVGEPGISFQSLDVMSDGRAYAVSTATITLFPQLFSVNLQTAAITAVNEQQTISDAIIAAGGDGFFANVGALGSVGNRLYAVDVRTSSLVELDPDSGAASVVGGTAGSLLSGELTSGISRARYSAFTALTGVDTNRDGKFDALFMGVNRFDDDNDAATPGITLGGVAKVDTTTGLWELVGTNPGYAYASFGSGPVPEPATAGMTALVALSCLARRRRPAAPVR